MCAAALPDPPEPARISVLLATRRPGHLAAALANVARQRYPRLELVLALHGPGFAPEAVERAIACFPHPVEVLRLDASRPLGSVLNAAADAASGALLAKMDDDDLYGAEHLWDLALAREYSGAALVGKFPATVYLARGDRTVRRRRVRSETWSASITGGAMLIGRADLERAGGWRRVPRHVDAALVEDVLRAGGGVYRTHDTGYPDGPPRRPAYLGGGGRRVSGRGRVRASGLAPGPRRHRGCAAPARARHGAGRCLTGRAAAPPGQRSSFRPTTGPDCFRAPSPVP